MKLEAKRGAKAGVRASGESPVVVIAGAPALRARIGQTLAEHGLRVAAELDSAESVADRESGASMVVVFPCEIDSPRQMASLRRLRRAARQLGIVVVSPPATATGVRRALDAGADALVFEPELELTLSTAVRGVASGQSVIPREFRASVERPVLSHRESEVLALVREGLTNAEIANRLFLAESTIKSHISSIFSKFGVHSRKEVAAAFADLEQKSDPENGEIGNQQEVAGE